jgi:hypothetical protein
MVTMKNNNNNDSGQDPSFLFLAQLQYFLGGGGGGGTAQTTTPFGGTATDLQATTKKVSDTSAATTKANWRTTATRFLRTTFARLRQVSILPALVAFWIGYKIGVSRTVTTMADIVLAPTAGRVVAPPTARETLRTMVLATALVFLLVREFWRGVPRWVKRQLPRLILPRQLSSRFLSKDQLMDSDHDDDSNMTSLPTIMRKLRSLLDLASDKLGLNKSAVPQPGSSSADMTTRNATANTTTATSSSSSSDNIESSMLVLLRLVRQIKEYRPDIRDAEFLAYDAVEKQTGDDAVITEYHRHMFELADAAYDELPQGQELRDFLSRLSGSGGYELLRHDATVVPGSVAHYVAVNRDTKQAVVGVKGTSSLEDLLTDCCGIAVDHDGMRCHDGILTASKRLAADLETILVDLLLPRGYTVTLTGHSLVRICTHTWTVECLD